jgi:hypothetical protein
MIFIAASAAGFGMVRGWVVLRSALPQIDSGNLPPRLLGFRDWYTAARLVLLALTMAIIPIGLRHSGPPRLGRWSRPGTIVPIVVTLAIAACLVDEGAFQHAVGFHYLYSSPAQRLFIVISQAVGIARAATAIGVAWLTLALAGRWEPEDDWVGRLGRVLGFAWIGACLGYRAYELVMYWRFGIVVV